jgi:hypothetical protein
MFHEILCYKDKDFNVTFSNVFTPLNYFEKDKICDSNIISVAQSQEKFTSSVRPDNYRDSGAQHFKRTVFGAGDLYQ